MAGSTDNPNILTGLNQVIQALNDLVLTSNCTPSIQNYLTVSCSCGSGGATPQDPSGTDTGDPGDPQGDPPDGFDTWEEYHTYKCNVATKIIDDLLADWQWYQSVNLYGVIAAALATALLTPIPGDELVILAAILAAILGYGTSIFQDVEDAIQNNYDDFICVLYSASNATQAESDLEDAFATALDAETSDEISRFEGKHAFNVMVGPASLNRLFDKDEALTGKLPTGDCSGCIDERYIELLAGSGPTPEWDTQQTFYSQSMGDYHSLQWRINPDGCAGSLATLRIEVQVQTTGAYAVRDCNNDTIESGPAETRIWTVGTEKCGAKWIFDNAGSNPFQMTVRFIDNDCTP